MDITVSYQPTRLHAISDAFFATTQNLLLDDLGSDVRGATLSDDVGTLVVGDEVNLETRPFIMLGSGIAQAGIDLYHVAVPIGQASDVILLEDRASGEVNLCYPRGAPDMLGASMVILDVDPVGYDLMANAPVCFCRGTLIQTPHGELPVETLAVGDQVVSFSGDVLEILWTASLRYDQPLPRARPVVIERGALGDRLPRRRLRVSPWHRLPLPGTAGHLPLLAPAAALTRLPRVRPEMTDSPVSYHQFVTESHAMVLAEGQPAETLFPADEALLNLSHDVRREMLEALGCTEETLADHPASKPCGRILSLREARQILRAVIAIDFAA